MTSVRRRGTARGRPVRAGISLAYLGVLLAAPLLDAAIEAINFEQVAHVESQTDAPCYAGHDEVMCQLCRLIHVPGFAAARIRLDVAPRTRQGIGQPSTPTHLTTVCLKANPSRAPPLA